MIKDIMLVMDFFFINTAIDFENKNIMMVERIIIPWYSPLDRE